MIQANELRIGNWYNCANPMEGGKLYPNQFTLWTEYLDFEAYGELLPLTPDLLIKSGFVKSREKSEWEYEYKNDYFLVIKRLESSELFHPLIAADVELYIEIPLPEMQYIHQLQNLYYALTGTELEIKL